jgi:hypothetical protein
MALYESSLSPLFQRFFQPVIEAYPHSSKPYDCQELTDLDFIEMGIKRCVSASVTGRDFLQHHGDNGRKEVSVDLHFKGLQSERRLANLASINALITPLLNQRVEDAFASIAELNGFAIYAGDGHYHAGAAHDEKRESSGGVMKKLAVGHFFMLNLRNHSMSHLAMADQSGTRKGEHDMHALKRSEIQDLRVGEPKGRKVILAWDKAGIDFVFWQKAKKTAGLYFISLEKSNMKLIRCGHHPFDREDPRNAGVIDDELVGPGGGSGAVFRRITYIDPVTGTRYVSITTEMTLPPGILALIYKQRWDIEKVFDEFKSKLEEKKSWASSGTAKTMQAQFLCLVHNLMVLLEEELLTGEEIDNDKERKRKAKRTTDALGKGANYVATMLQRFTVRSLKYIRWLRNFFYREVPWSEAVARLRAVYVSF